MLRGVITALILSSLLSADIIGDLKVAALRVSFKPDDNPGTTGNGQFLSAAEYDTCDIYTIDPPPHDRLYFEAQLKALDNYFRAVSYDQFGLDTVASTVFPATIDGSYQLADSMSYYHGYNEDDLHDERITLLLRDAIDAAYASDQLDFGQFDLVVVFHAGIGQDFSLPYLDPTPEDIPSTYVDPEMVASFIDPNGIAVGNTTVTSGIILPETQNHLLYDIAEDIFAGVDQPCELQFGLTGTFALMTGFAIGLPPLWDIESGEAGIGVFGLMDQGSNNGRGLIPAPPDAWTRIFAGWEQPLTVDLNSTVELARRSRDAVIRVDINDHEYFLIENRLNWFRHNVSIDSVRWAMFNAQKDAGEIDPQRPPFVEILFDSVKPVIDPTGVVTAVPNYDLGLPGSGMLIWHIDENVISDGIDQYEINADPDRFGVDLEEADGAQDIGHPSIFAFTDPSAGYFADMWFQGNGEYYRAHPTADGQPLRFGPLTFPDTRANSGAATYLAIDGIGPAADTASLQIINTLVPAGFPQDDFNPRLVVDINGDGISELVGGADTLWHQFAPWETQRVFWTNPVGNSLVTVAGDGESESFLIAARIENGVTKVTSFRYSTGDTLKPVWSKIISVGTIDGLWGDRDDNIAYLLVSDRIIKVHSGGSNDHGLIEDEQFYIYCSHRNPTDDFEFYYDGIQLSTVGVTAGEVRELAHPAVRATVTVDLDLDGRGEIIIIDSTGTISAFNSNFTLLPGFPVDFAARPPLLARNLLGSDHPELIFTNSANEILVVDHRGSELIRLANSTGGKLSLAGDYFGRSAIYSTDMVWAFDSVTVTDGNEWNTPNGDWYQDHTLVLEREAAVNTTGLADLKHSYAYPNPAKGNAVKFRVEVGHAETITINIYDIAGYFVQRLTLDEPVQNVANEIVWNVAAIESGVYLAYLEVNGNGSTDSKIIKVGIIK